MRLLASVKGCGSVKYIQFLSAQWPFPSISLFLIGESDSLIPHRYVNCTVPCLKFVSRLARVTFRFPHHHGLLNLNTLLYSVELVGSVQVVSRFKHDKKQHAGASMSCLISDRHLTGWRFPRIRQFVLPVRLTCGWMNECGAMVEWYWQGKLKCWERNVIQRGW